MNQRIKIGVVPYLNALPLIEGLEESSGVDLRMATPAELEAGLDDGTLDAAMVPVITLFSRPHLAMFPFAGIASEEEAGSVLFFKRPGCQAIERVAYDHGSRTSVALLRIILAEEGIQPDWVAMEPNLDKMLALADGALLIGDVALAAAKDPRLVFDLVARWKKMTGLPFVFAVWAARADHPRRAELTRLFTDASMRGLSRPASIAQRKDGYMGMSALDILTYYTKNLRYRLGIIHMDAIDLFRQKCAKLPPLPAAAAAVKASSSPSAASLQARTR